MIHVHLIPNAHIDPIWLWPWTAGLDEAIATCRTACDLMDRHADMTFCLGDAWVLEQVEHLDPRTLTRIQALVAADRWDVSGGWYIQPDCNFPLSESITRQIEIGLGFMRDRLGTAPGVAMNVDSFGHAASLPTLLRQGGQHSYVMMRPQEHEMSLPARLFRWRDAATGECVTTFRIASSYTTTMDVSVEHIRASLTHLPPGVEHTMCFIGVGDHGGGPTEAMLEWCREHRHAVDGAELLFSTPTRFFEAVAPTHATLPIVTGELQFHAIGCYSVEGRLKRSVRRAERLLLQSERCGGLDPSPPRAAATRRNDAWRSVCFHQFHDTIGGTCVPSAYPFVFDDVGGAAAEAQRQSAHAMRRIMLDRLGDDPLQRIVLFNPSPHVFDGYVEVESWCEFTSWQPTWTLLDGEGVCIPYQTMEGESHQPHIGRVLFRARLGPDEMRAIRIDRGGGAQQAQGPGVWATRDRLANDQHVSIHHQGRDVVKLEFGPESPPLPAPKLALIADPTDTWSHGVDRYAAGPATLAHWGSVALVNDGPLMSSWVQEGRIGESSLFAEWRLYAGMRVVDLRLRIMWEQRHQVLKLIWSTSSAINLRTDGSIGGETVRPTDGREYPVHDWVRVRHEHGDQAIVCPDAFAADVDAGHVRITLLRSPVLAHHDPHASGSPCRQFADRGEHVFSFRFLMDQNISSQTLAAYAGQLQLPPMTADLTRGMPARRVRGQTGP